MSRKISAMNKKPYFRKFFSFPTNLSLSLRVQENILITQTFEFIKA